MRVSIKSIAKVSKIIDIAKPRAAQDNTRSFKRPDRIVTVISHKMKLVGTIAGTNQRSESGFALETVDTVDAIKTIESIATRKPIQG